MAAAGCPPCELFVEAYTGSDPELPVRSVTVEGTDLTVRLSPAPVETDSAAAVERAAGESAGPVLSAYAAVLARSPPARRLGLRTELPAPERDATVRWRLGAETGRALAAGELDAGTLAARIEETATVD